MNPTFLKKYQLALVSTAFTLLLAVPGTLLSSQSPRMIRIQGMVEAFNTGEPQALLSFLESNATPDWTASRPAEGRLKLFEQLMHELGTLESTGVEFDGVSQATIRLSSTNTEDNVLFQLTFEKESPYRITALGIDLTPGLPDGIAPLPSLADLGETKFLNALDAYLQDLTDSDEFAGTVLIARDGKPIFKGAYGLADRSWEIPNKMSTRFNLGSINKQLTKIAVGQLLAAGKLSLSDTLGDHLPEYPNVEAAQKVRIQHLLDHSAGLGDIFVPEFFETNKARLRSNEDYFEIFGKRLLEFEPGTETRYSNAGFIVLGAIVSAASGQPYTEYIEEHIFGPAGMTGAGFLAVDEIHPDVARGYTRSTGVHEEDGVHGEEGPLHPNTFMLPVVGMGAGGAVATAADLLALDQAMREHRLLEPRYSAWLLSGTLPDEDPGADPIELGIGIAGGAPGVNALLESVGAVTVVFLTNLDPPSATAVGLAVARELRKGS